MSKINAPLWVTGNPAVVDELARLSRRSESTDASTPLVNAITLNGLDSDYVLNRLYHTGPRYHDWRFRDERAGMVVRDPNLGTLCRLYPYDTDDPDNPSPSVEIVTTVYPTDYIFDSGCGPVTQSPWSGTWGRWGAVIDGGPQLQVTPLASTGDIDQSRDLWFWGGHSWFNRGRNTGTPRDYWWYFDDRDGGPQPTVENVHP